MLVSQHSAQALIRLNDFQPSRASVEGSIATSLSLFLPFFKVIFKIWVKRVSLSYDFLMAADVGISCPFKVKGFVLTIFIFYRAMELPVVSSVKGIILAYDPSFPFVGVLFKPPAF